MGIRTRQASLPHFLYLLKMRWSLYDIELRLKAHFEDNPRDLDLLKHDKVLRAVPEYLLDPVTQEASKIAKLARAAMGNAKSTCRQGSKRKFGKSIDPLKTFSAEVCPYSFFSLCN